jgi:hypothetical protein
MKFASMFIALDIPCESSFEDRGSILRIYKSKIQQKFSHKLVIQVDPETLSLIILLLDNNKERLKSRVEKLLHYVDGIGEARIESSTVQIYSWFDNAFMEALQERQHVPAFPMTSKSPSLKFERTIVYEDEDNESLAFLPVNSNFKFSEGLRLEASQLRGGVDKNSFITCDFIKNRTQDFLRYHYQFDRFNSELSERIFLLYFKILDPHKIYFYEDDIKKFEAFKMVLGERIHKEDCSFLEDINKIYKKRVTESLEIVKEILKKPFDYTVDEFIETDRKKVEWAKDKGELHERWRKTLKFLSLNMKSIESERKVED